MHKKALKHALPDSSSAETVDYRKSANPYRSRYGDKWEDQLKSCSTLSPFHPISDLVTFIAKESHRLMQRTAREQIGSFGMILCHYSRQTN